MGFYAGPSVPLRVYRILSQIFSSKQTTQEASRRHFEDDPKVASNYKCNLPVFERLKTIIIIFLNI